MQQFRPLASSLCSSPAISQLLGPQQTPLWSQLHWTSSSAHGQLSHAASQHMSNCCSSSSAGPMPPGKRSLCEAGIPTFTRSCQAYVTVPQHRTLSLSSRSWLTMRHSNTSSSNYWCGEQAHVQAFTTSTASNYVAEPSKSDSPKAVSEASPSSSSSTISTGPSSSSSDNSSSGSNAQPGKLQLPPVVVSGATATAAAATKLAKAGARKVSKLVKLIQSTSLSEATWLQLSSIWQAHRTAITMAAAATGTAGLYHLTTAAAGHFVDVTSTTASLSCLAASAAAVTAAGLHVRSNFTVDPDRVYEVAMRKLSGHAGLQEVMGSPLAGSEVRVEFVTRGNLFIQETLLPKRRAPRIHMLFQLSGPVKSGVVSLEAKKALGGKYAFKTLLVELPGKTLTGQAAAAAAEAAVKRAAAAAEAVEGKPDRRQATNDNSSSSSRVASSSSSSSSATASVSEQGKATEPARIYIIGGPDSIASSSNSSRQEPSPRVLLEELKQPLIYALQKNIVVYEAEDEVEAQLSWTRPQCDPAQATWWDKTKQGLKVLGCKSYKATRKAAAAAAATAKRISSSSGGRKQTQTNRAAEGRTEGRTASSSGDVAATPSVAGGLAKTGGSGPDRAIGTGSTAAGEAAAVVAAPHAPPAAAAAVERDIKTA